MEQFYVEKNASRGIAVAPAFKYQEPELGPCRSLIPAEAVPEEKQKFKDARDAVIRELSVSAAENKILSASLEIAGDILLEERMEEKISGEHKNAQLALTEAIQEFSALFDAMEDTYIRERGEDVRDIGKRMMAKLKGAALPDLGALPGEVIVVAKDLYPWDTIRIDGKHVKGIITEEGGITSHVSILARSMGIPVLVGVTGIFSKLSGGEMLCMDAQAGFIAVNPDEKTLAGFLKKRRELEKERSRLEGLRTRPPVTRAGKRVLLCANVGSLEEIKKALPMRIDGVGLFRTEYLYMESAHIPTEEEQYEVYRKAALLTPGQLTIRTLDVGGDKELPSLKLEKEENPFLGWRGIRILLDRKDLFKAQLRAILRASAAGSVRILFPMMISLEELREAKAVVKECKEELRVEGLAFDEGIAIGIMAETPASVLLAEEFAAESDFFSIGTNDLAQYLLAVDRGNPKVAGRFNVFHPAVLRAIRQLIDAGHRAGIPVGMCGEMAADPQAVGLLVSMGLDEFSMAAESLDFVREQILTS